MALDPLTDRDAAIIELEGQFWATAGAKEQAIRDQLAMTTVRYYLRLNQLLDTESALALYPVLVNRCNRMRSSRGRRTLPA